ncbi:MAG: ribosome maturation factor RimP [Clostridia bacterium]|jgi:ribosome maturation factor RimP|nr:ribosome maturation factor RimP [Clostridia bacterium]MBQ2092777.1 ribosome maturation factor RimP [Clostridia bacterium]
MANVTDKIWELAEPLASDLGLSIWDVRYVKEGADWFLRIFIDKEGGVSIDDCVEMTHAIDGPLDELDPIKDAYTLEVSSPGAERALTRDEHFEKYIGSKVMVKLIRPLDGKREFKGILKGYDKGDVTVETDDTSFVFNKKEASYVKLDDFDDYIAE